MAKKPTASKRSPRPSKKKDAKKKAALRRFIRARGGEYLDDPNITSIGIGHKNGDGELSIVFTVSAKAEESDLETLQTKMLPEKIEVEGYTFVTDVEQRQYNPSFEVVPPQAPNPRKTRSDPIFPGSSVCHVAGTAGTLGMIVFDADDGAPCILSNWHVLHGPHGLIGETIVQPSPADDNNVAGNACAALLRSHLGPAGDCALAKVQGRAVSRILHGLNVIPKKMADVDLGDKLVKSGRSTGVTYGIVRRMDVMVQVTYDSGIGTRTIGGFEIGVDPARPSPNGEISSRGDSGSVWMIANGAKSTDVFAGLHFAGEGTGNTDEHAIACYPLSVQRKLRFVLEPPANLSLDDDPAETGVGRAGFNAEFLGIPAPMPSMSLAIKRDAVNFGSMQTIPYTHFSVCLSAKRRLARFVAWNIDGSRRVVLPSHDFKTDTRIDAVHQTDNALYADNKLDRGHIARRADLAWGPVHEAQQANQDSFFYTNIAPQHERFNRSNIAGLWGRLENLILEQANTQGIRVSVLAGPIFDHANDPEYRGIQIPSAYWKLIAYRAADGKLSSSAFILSQRDLLHDFESLDFDSFRMFQVSVEVLATRTSLGFDSYKASDAFKNPSRAAHEAFVRIDEGANARSGMREVIAVENITF